MVFPWALEQLPVIMKEAPDIDLFDIDLLHDDRMLDNPCATLADIGVKDGDQLFWVGRIDEVPPLMFSSDSDA
jgi:hypothetical protein